MNRKLSEALLALATLILLGMVARPAIDYIQTLRSKNTISVIKSLNEATERARIQALSGPGTSGTDPAAAVLWLKDKNLIAKTTSIPTENLWVLDGKWAQSTLPEKAEEILERVTPKPNPEANLQSLLHYFGATTPTGLLNKIQEKWCQPTSVETFLEKNFGAPNFAALARNWELPNEEAAAQAALKKPLAAAKKEAQQRASQTDFPNPEAALKAWFGTEDLQTIADQSFPTPDIPEIPQAAIEEIAAKWQRFPPETIKQIYDAVTIASPTQETLLTLHRGLIHALEDDDSLAEDPNIQETLFDMLLMAETLGCQKGLNLSKLNLEGRSLANLDLRGTNLSGEQVNSASEIAFANLAGMNLNGLDPTKKSLQNTNLEGTTGLNISQILAATTLRGANLSGIDFEHTSLAGKDLSEVTISGAKNLDGRSFNGVANVTGARLEYLDLSQWTVIPFNGNNNSSVKSFRGSNLNHSLLTKNQLARNACLAEVNLSGWQPQTIDYQLNLSGTKIPAQNLNGIAAFLWTNFGTMNLSGFIWEGKNLGGSNLSQTTGWRGTQLNSLTGVVAHNRGVILDGQNLAGWRPIYSIQNSSLKNCTGLTPEALAISPNIRGIRLKNTGITKESLRGALEENGRTPEAAQEEIDSIQWD